MQIFSFVGRKLYPPPVTSFLSYLKITALFVLFAGFHATADARTTGSDKSSARATATTDGAMHRDGLFESNQQQFVVQGSVADTSGAPLIGATVSVKNQTNLVTSTDQNGRFVLQVPDNNAVLVFTMVGYHALEITVGTQREIDASSKLLRPCLTT